MSKTEEHSGEVEIEIKNRLKRLAEFYGETPFVSRKLADSPNLFLPFSDLSRRLLMEPEHLSMKEMEIAAVAASAALGSEHCLNVHIPQALKVGATKDELTEVIMVATFMAMTRGQSIALRKLAEQG
jgi:AhpD family alkylhydroperoxidase